MSEVIDEKVVEMRFDNSQFERNVKTSMDTVDNLKKSLKLDKASEGLEKVNATASKFGATGLAQAVQTVGLKFNAMQIAGVTAFATLVHNATNAASTIATKFAKAITIEPIQAGFSEYETQMNAVQTILANTQKEGTNVKIVNSALDELNHYADKTIYNFTEMTRNIGTFTAAGVKLDTSVSSIKGIANLAAVSGSTSQQASTAMYQLSQAIAAGTVRLMDWNSVVNAGMGGQVFQDALIRTSEKLGTGAQAYIDAEGSFRESLSKGWLTTEVLTQTLDQFATAADTEEEYAAAVEKFVKQGYTEEQAKQMADMARTAGQAATKVKTFSQLLDTLKEALGSGWTESWRIVIGDFEEAKALWTSVSDYLSDVINKSSDARNSLLTAWSKSGRGMAIQSIKNAFDGLLSVLTPIKEAFQEVFPAPTVDTLLKITRAVRDFTKNLKLNDDQMAMVKSTAKGLFSFIRLALDLVVNLGKGLIKLLSHFKGLGDGILSLTAKLGDWISGYQEYVKETNAFGESVGNIVGFLEDLGSSVKDFFTSVKDKFKDMNFDWIDKLMEDFKMVFGTINDIFTQVTDNFSKNAPKIKDSLSEVGTGLDKVLGSGHLKDGAEAILKVINGGLIATVIISIKKFIDGMTDAKDNANQMIETFKTIGESAKNFVDHATKILDSVRDSLKSFQTTLKVATLLELAIAVAILAGAIVTLSKVNPEKLAASLGAVTVLLGDLMASMAIFNKINGSYDHAASAVLEMIGLSVAVNILASALKKLGDLNIQEIGVGVAGITALIAELVAAIKILTIDGEKSIKGADTLLALAISLKIATWAFKDIASLDLEQVLVGMTGITAIITELVAAIKILTNEKEKVIQGTGTMIVMTGVIAALAGVMKLIATMSWDDLGRGITGMTASIALLIAALKVMTIDEGKAIRGAGSLLIISGALAALAGTMKLIGTMSWKELASGLTAVGISMAILATGLNTLKGSKGAAGSLLVASGALTLLAVAIKSIGNMKWDDVAKGLVAIGGSMAILVVGLNAMQGSIQGSAALLVAAVAINGLALSFRLFEKIKIDTIIKGLVTIAATFALFGVAGAALESAIPGILAVSGAIALLGVSCFAIGAGVSLALGSLTALFSLIAVSGAVIAKSINVIVSNIVDLVPTIASGLAAGFVAFVQGIASGADALFQSVKDIIISALDAIIELVPSIVTRLLRLVLDVINGLTQFVPQIVESLCDFLIGVFDALAVKAPELGNKFTSVIIALFSGVKEALKDVDQRELLEGIAGLTLIVALMNGLASAALLAPLAIVGVIAMGEVISELAIVLASIGIMSKLPGLTWLINEGSTLLSSIGTTIGKFLGSIASGIGVGATSQLPTIATSLSEFMANIEPFITGVKSVDKGALAGAALLADAILCITAAEVVQGIGSLMIGDSSMSTFGSELEDFGKALAKFSDSVTGVDSNAIKSAAEAGKAIAEMASTIPNEGGMVAWFTGDNSLAKFGPQMASFGNSLRAFSYSVKDVDQNGILSAVKAAEAIAKMAEIVPNEGGIVAWFSGDNSLAKFGSEMAAFGNSLRAFAFSVNGIDADQISGIAGAAKAIAEMADIVPNSDGITAWFSGDNSLAKFGSEMAAFGNSLRAFAFSVNGIDADQISGIAGAAKAIAEMADIVPNSDGITAWFSGDNSLAKFGSEIAAFGNSLRAFAFSVAGIDPATVTAAATAGKTLAEMADTIPNQGGVAAWFAGDNSMASFGSGIAAFGNSLRAFAFSVAGIDPATVTAAATAGKTLAEMTSIVPNEGGMRAWFAGDKSMASFGSGIAAFGNSLNAFSTSVNNINTGAVNAAATAGKTLAEMTNTIPSDSYKLDSFGLRLADLAKDMASFAESMDGVNVMSAVNQIEKIIGLASKLTGVDSSGFYDFSKALKNLGKEGVSKFAGAFDGGHSKVQNAIYSFINAADKALNDKKDKFFETAKKFMNRFIDGIDEKKDDVTTKCKSIIHSIAVNIHNSGYSEWYQIGQYFADGLISGIEHSESKVKEAAINMAKSAKSGVEETLDIHSPSRVAYKQGSYYGLGFVNALDDYRSKTYDAGEYMGNSAREGLDKAISRVIDVMNSDVDYQPTITPVIDLSNVRSGISTLNGLMPTNSISATATISQAMANANQNRISETETLTNAITDLRKDLGSSRGDSYVINGITYDDGSNVSSAVSDLIRAVKIERRR